MNESQTAKFSQKTILTASVDALYLLRYCDPKSFDWKWRPPLVASA